MYRIRHALRGSVVLFRGLPWRIKLAVCTSACLILLIASLWAYTTCMAFIRPGDSYDTTYFASSASYCTAWAADHEHVGTPTAGPCGVLLVGVNLSPSDAMPFTADKYAPGNCTYWAALRRGQTGRAIPNTWGDAYLWAGRARADGYAVDHTPTVGAIMQTAGGSLGHVAYVESVAPDGTWHISEMNVIGLGEVDYRAFPPSAATYYNFIH